MFKLLFYSAFLLLPFLSAEEESKVKPGAKLQIDVSFLPPVVALYKGERLRSEAFLSEYTHRLNPLAREKFNRAGLVQYIKQLIEEKYDRIASLELAKNEGVDPNIGIAFFELQQMEKKVGKEELTRQLQANGIDYDSAAEYMAESKSLEEWFDKKIVPVNKVNEAEALLFYSENPERFTVKERVKFAQIYTGFLLEEEKVLARKKIQKVNHLLSIGEKFTDLAKKHSEGKFAALGGVQDKFYSEDELIRELKSILTMEVGNRSTIIESSNGYHIIKVLEKRPAGQLKFDEIKKGLMLTMSVEKAKTVMNEKIQKHKKESGFRILLE